MPATLSSSDPGRAAASVTAGFRMPGSSSSPTTTRTGVPGLAISSARLTKSSRSATALEASVQA